MCRRCLGEHLTAAPDVGHCSRCGSTVERSLGSVHCPVAAAVVVRDATGAEQALCLSHATVAVRQVHSLAVVAASRHSRTVLAEVAAGSCVISGRVRRLADAAAVAAA